MDDMNVPIFGQAKLEYTKQLVDILYMNIYDGVRSIYDDAKVVYVNKRVPVVQIFRSLLEQVPKWNSEIIKKETDRIEKTSKCDWLDELLTAVFISHTRILMSIGSNHNFNKINVTIPKTTTFIHKSYINIAREVWKNPYLFDEQVPGHEYQRNMKQLEDMIKLTIEDTIRRQLPIKEILREHLENANEPKQTQPQLDMKTLVDELRKATTQVNNSSNYDTMYDTDGDDGGNNSDENISDNNFSTIFSKEENESLRNNELSINPDINNSSFTDNAQVSNYVAPETSPFKDSDDPDEDQIKKATQNIVLNDITEPVVEPTYDNTDIVSPTKSENNDNKLENMVKELNMGEKKDTAPVVKIDKLNDSSVTPSITPSSNTSKSSNPLTTVVKKEGTPPSITPPSITPPSITPSSTPSVSPFSFDNMYSGTKGVGKVEEGKVEEGKVEEGKVEEGKGKVIIGNSGDVSKPVTKDMIIIKDDTVKDNSKTISTNADVMKEVISLDKKEEQIDDTQSLDVFFSDIQKMVNPSMNTMEPIKEETKYTLFEDAHEKE